MSKISTKTVARIAAIQALYQYQINGSSQTIEELRDNIINYYRDQEMYSDNEVIQISSVKIKMSVKYFSELLTQTLENLSKIDNVIEEHLARDEPISTLHLSLISLLRIAICELYYFPEVPYKVVINEFTDISSDLLSDNEVAFVNSILQALYMKRSVLGANV